MKDDFYINSMATEDGDMLLTYQNKQKNKTFKQ